MVLTLYKLDASPPARAAMMVLEALKIKDVKYNNVSLMDGEHMKPDYLKINPQHTIPTLTDDDFALADSHAIAGYLVNKYGKDDALYPKDAKKRAIVDQRLHFDSGILFPALRYTIAPVIFLGATAYSAENLEKIQSAYAFSEAFLVKQYAAGDQLTIADICWAATISSLDAVTPIDAAKYPKLAAWLARVSKLDFYQKANIAGLQQLAGLLKSKLAK